MMVEIFCPVAPPSFSPAIYRQGPPISRPADVSAPPWPYADVGTGGVYVIGLALYHVGYPMASVGEHPDMQPEPAPHVLQMRQVKAGFGRTMSRLPEVFGVSRQTLYNWLNGETPKEAHAERLRQLAEAAALFADMHFKPTSASLDRTLLQGMSFLQLLAQGENGKEMARKLIRVHQRSESSRAKLDAVLGGQKARPTAEDIGAPSLNEDA